MNETTTKAVPVGQTTITPSRCFILKNQEKPTKAFIDIDVGGIFTIKGLKIVTGKNGLFVSMPQSQNNGRWYDDVRCLSRDIRDEVESIVLKYYKSEAKV